MNRKMKDDGWWEAIRTKVEMTDTSVPDDLWEGLATAVDASMRRRRIRKASLRVSLLGAAAALAIVLALPRDCADVPSAAVAAAAATAETQAPAPVGTSDSGPAYSKGPATIAAPVVSNDIAVAEPTSVPETDIIVRTETAASSEPAAKKEKHSSAKPVSQTIEQYLACDDEPAIRRHRIHISLSGSGEPLNQNTTYTITGLNSISIITDDGSELEFPIYTSKALSSREVPQGMPDSRTSDLSTYRYLPPVTVRLAVAADLSGHLGIESGLAYTVLDSYISKSGNGCRHRLQFVGIPLSLRVTALQNGRSSIYATAGGQVDKCVKADYGFGDVRTIDHLFWSATATLGYQYALLPQLGLFAEAGGAYHFSNGIQEMTIYTEHPLQASLQAGLRFDLNN